jgi:hypothetical protein
MQTYEFGRVDHFSSFRAGGHSLNPVWAFSFSNQKGALGLFRFIYRNKP